MLYATLDMVFMEQSYKKTYLSKNQKTIDKATGYHQNENLNDNLEDNLTGSTTNDSFLSKSFTFMSYKASSNRMTSSLFTLKSFLHFHFFFDKIIFKWHDHHLT